MVRKIKAKTKISVVVSIALLISFISIFLFPKLVKSQAGSLVITCDKDVYYGLTKIEAYCNVTNGGPININFTAFFPSVIYGLEGIYDLRNVTYEEQVIDHYEYYEGTNHTGEVWLVVVNDTLYLNYTTLNSTLNTTRNFLIPLYAVWRYSNSSYEGAFDGWWTSNASMPIYVNVTKWKYDWVPLSHITYETDGIKKYGIEGYSLNSNNGIFKIVFNVPPNTQGKFNLTVSVDGEIFELDPWWDSNWLYRNPITIDNTQNPNTLTDYQVLVNLDTATLISDGKMNSDCSDIRFSYLNSDNTETEIPYWIEGRCNTPNTKIWVKVPYIPASSTATIYAYYGNPSASSTSNPANVFIPNSIYAMSGNYWGYIWDHWIANDVRTRYPDICTKYVSKIDWGSVCDESAFPSHVRDIFYSRFRFLFLADVSGTYTFGIDSDDGSEAMYSPTDRYGYYLSESPSGYPGETVIVSWYGPHGIADSLTTYTGTYYLDAGQGIWIDVVHSEVWGGEAIRLGIQKPGGEMLIVDANNFPNQIFARQYTYPEPRVSLDEEEIILPIRISKIVTYDSNLNQKIIFYSGDTVRIRTNVAHDNGTYYIDNVLITIIDPSNNIVVNNESMIAVSPIDNGYTYEYNYSITDATPSGTWKVIVYASDTLDNNNLRRGVFYVNYVEVTQCLVISQPGEYRLTQDILNPNVQTCINIQADNVILDCQGYRIDSGNPNPSLDSIGIYVNGHSGITIKNCYLNNWYEGVRIENSNSNTIINIDGIATYVMVHLINSNSNTISNVGRGWPSVLLDWSSYNTISNIDGDVILSSSNSNSISNIYWGFVGVYYSNNNDISYVNGGVHMTSSNNNRLSDIMSSGWWRGINIEYSNYNKISDSQITGCWDVGIYMYSSSNNEISNVFLDSNSVGIRIDNSNNNIIRDSVIQNSWNYGIHIISSQNNQIFNNIFNNNNNFYFEGAIYTNYWNTTLQEGTNIWNSSLGYIGGNLWTTPSNNGYSDTCVDNNFDGFCDQPYYLTGSNIDYLPIAKYVGQGYSPLNISIKTYDYNLVEKFVFYSGETVRIRANVTHEIDVSYIDNVLITIIDPSNNIVVNNESMIAVSPIDNGYTYEYNYTLLRYGSNGDWKLIVYANDTLGYQKSSDYNFRVYEILNPSDWLYRIPITIDNTQNPNTLIDYQVLVTLDTASLISVGKMRPDCGDIRFALVNDILLSYWIEGRCNTPNTKIWVKVPYIPASSTATIYAYYGNPSATSISNGYETFDIFDDFEGDVYSRWTALSGSLRIISDLNGQSLQLLGGDRVVSNKRITSSWQFYRYEFNLKYASFGIFGPRLIANLQNDSVVKVGIEIEIGGGFNTNYLYGDGFNTLFYYNTWNIGYVYNMVVYVLPNALYWSRDGGLTTFMYQTGISNDVTGERYILFYTWDYGNDVRIDDLRVRKFTDPEPTTILGAEETITPYPPSYTEISFCTQITSPGEYRLVNDIIDVDVSVCIDIQSDNVILDCQGHILDQSYPPSEWYGIGINIDGYSNVTIKNCVFGDWLYYGVYSYSSSDITILNSSFTFGSNFDGYAIFFYRPYSFYIDNITSYRFLRIFDGYECYLNSCYLNNLYLSGAYAGIYIWSSNGIALKNIKMIGTQPISIENSAGINVTNAYIGALSYGIELYSVEVSNFNNIEIYGIDRDSYHAETGIYFYSSNYNNFRNITIRNFEFEGIWFYRWSSGNTFINVSISDIFGYSGMGVLVSRESNDNYFKGLSIRNVSEVGIFVDYAVYNVFEDFTISDIVDKGIWVTSVEDTNEFRNGLIELTGYGVRLEDAANQVFHGIIIRNSEECGIYLWSSENNLFYNNIFMNMNNVCFGGPTYPNYWNTTLQEGNNIWNASLGYIGGNLWTTPDNNGYSDTCVDANYDGFCDDPYYLTSDGSNVDYLPIAKYVGQNVAPPTLSVVFNYNSVDFGTVIPYTIAEAKSINYNVSITSSSDYKVLVNATDWNGATTIPANTLYFAVNDTLDNLSFATAKQLSNEVQLIATFPSSVTTNYHAFYFNVPLVPPGSYIATITITYEVA